MPFWRSAWTFSQKIPSQGQSVPAGFRHAKLERRGNISLFLGSRPLKEASQREDSVWDWQHSLGTVSQAGISTLLRQVPRPHPRDTLLPQTLESGSQPGTVLCHRLPKEQLVKSIWRTSALMQSCEFWITQFDFTLPKTFKFSRIIFQLRICSAKWTRWAKANPESLKGSLAHWWHSVSEGTKLQRDW